MLERLFKNYAQRQTTRRGGSAPTAAPSLVSAIGSLCTVKRRSRLGKVG